MQKEDRRPRPWFGSDKFFQSHLGISTHAGSIFNATVHDVPARTQSPQQHSQHLHTSKTQSNKEIHTKILKQPSGMHTSKVVKCYGGKNISVHRYLHIPILTLLPWS